MEALLKPFFPYIAKGFFFPKDKANWIASGIASVISGSTGTRTQVLTKTQPLVQMMVSEQPYTMETYEGISKYIDAYKKDLEKIHKNPNQSYSQSFYSTLLNQGGFYEVIPMYKEYLDQYKATNDAKEKQAIANKMQEYTDRAAEQMYEKIRHSLFYKIIQAQMGEKKANEYIADIVSDTIKYAYTRAKQQSTKEQTSQIFPNEEQKPTQTQQPTQQEQPQPQQQSNSQDIGTIIKQASQTYGVPEKLIKAVIQAESSGNPNAVSPKGAVGLMQLEPSTAQELGVTDINDPQQNIMGGAKYLSYLIKKYKGDFVLALAAYNAGPNAVDKYGGVPPNGETIDYINRVADIYNNT
jgi:soluble lytic murein transglycosylase-like protein